MQDQADVDTSPGAIAEHLKSVGATMDTAADLMGQATAAIKLKDRQIAELRAALRDLLPYVAMGASGAVQYRLKERARAVLQATEPGQ